MSGRLVTNSGKSESAPEMDVPEVVYVRMSTDHQKYSTENQLDVIGREIAEILNAEGHRTDLDRLWARAIVHQVLTNEKYIGNNVFAKVSFKLKQRRVVNPRDMWIRAEGA